MEDLGEVVDMGRTCCDGGGGLKMRCFGKGIRRIVGGMVAGRRLQFQRVCSLFDV